MTHAHHHSDPMHKHSYFAHTERRELTLWVAVGLTALFMVVELVAGLWSGSLALIADSIHMLADAGALGLALFAVRLSHRHADDHRTFGYGRMQVLAAFINGLLVTGISVLLWKEAYHRFRDPVTVNSDMMLWVAVAGFLVNLAVFAVLHRGDSKSMNIRAASLHVLSDLLSSGVVILAALGIGYLGFDRIDSLASLAVSLLIAWSAKDILRESGHILLEGRPPELRLEAIASAIREAVPEVEGIHHLHAWSLSGEDVLATMHAALSPASARLPDDVLRQIKGILRDQFHIHHSTVQLEYAGCADAIVEPAHS